MTRKIFLAVPTHSGDIDYTTHLSIMRAMCDASHRGWTLDSYFRPWDSVISRARNVIFSAFLETDCTDLFFLDADIGCEPGAIIKLIEHDVDIVGGSYPNRGDPEDYIIKTLPGGTMEFNKETKLMEVEAVPTGFMRISRKAAEKMRWVFGDHWYRDKTAGGLTKVYNVFDFQLIDHEYWSEDYTFCRRWRDDCGGKVWLDPTIRLDHTGKKMFRGRMLDYLNKNCKIDAATGATITAEAPQSILEAARAMVAKPAPTLEAAA